MSESVSVFPIQVPNRTLTLTFSLSILLPSIGLSQAADFNSIYCLSKAGTIFSAATPWMVSLMASCVFTNTHHPNFRLSFMLIAFSNMETIKQETCFLTSVYATMVQSLHQLSQNSFLTHLSYLLQVVPCLNCFPSALDLLPLGPLGE